MQHWNEVHKDMINIYNEEITAPEAAKPKEGKKEGGTEKEDRSEKKVRQAIYDIRYRARREGVPIARAFNDYMKNTSMGAAERTAVKSKLGEENEEYGYNFDWSTLQFDEQTNKYKVRVVDKNSGRSYVRYATREKITQLRANPNISSVEMTDYGIPYEGEKKKGSQTSKVKSGKGLDPVGKEDGDVDNDGDKDSSDEYLMKRRKAIAKSMKKEEKSPLDEWGNVYKSIYGIEVTEKKKDDTYLEPDMKKRQANNEKARKELAKGPQMKNPHFESKNIEVPFKADLKSMVKKAVKRVDADVDGDVDSKDKKEKGMGEYLPLPDGKKFTPKVKTESKYNWRSSLSEVMGDKKDDDEKIDVMKGKNKIKINPPMKKEEYESEISENVSEDSRYCRLCRKKETKEQCGYGPKMWMKYSVKDATEQETEDAAQEAGIVGESTQRDQQIQRKQLQLNRMKLQQQQKAVNKKDTNTDMSMREDSLMSVQEKLDMKKDDMGDVIKDFQKSDAPQFRGKTKEERRKMAIAAKLAAKSQQKEEAIKESEMVKQITSTRNKVYDELQKAKNDRKKEDGLEVTKQTSGFKPTESELDGAKNEEFIPEEDVDSVRDRRQERGGMDGNTNYNKPPSVNNNTSGKKKPSKRSAIDVVRNSMIQKYGKDSIISK